MPDTRNILFLTLRTFSATGGIEKVCRLFCHALAPYSSSFFLYSLYDRQSDEMVQYTAGAVFRGFSFRRLHFILTAINRARSCDMVVLSHVNLLSVGWIIKLLFPRKKLILFSHGIEVWDDLNALRKLMLRKCNLLFAVSNFTKEQLVLRQQVPAEKIFVLNNCIDPFLPVVPSVRKSPSLMKKYGLGEHDFVLMTLTRLSSSELYKGYDQVLKALADLHVQYPQIKYIMVGKSDAAEEQRLYSLVQELQIDGRVVFVGFIPDAELADHFGLADLYIMPSKKEGFGIVFVEALHYGVPVIAGNVDGSVDALCGGRLGILVDPDNLDEIKKSILQVMAHPKDFTPDHTLLKQHFSFSTYRENAARFLGLKG